MPSNADNTNNSSQVSGVRYTEDGLGVLCEHCDVVIPRGTDFAVRLTCPEAGIIEPIGPYCKEHLESLKVCCGCHRPFFGEDEISYLGEGEYFCNSCKEGIITCESCDSRTTEEALVTVPNGTRMCPTCFGKKYFTCSCCDTVKTISRSWTEDTPLNQAKYPTILSGSAKVCNLCFLEKSAGVAPLPVTQCRNCGKMHGDVGSSYCIECVGRLSNCDGCGKMHHQMYSFSVDGEHMTLCPSCRSKAQDCTSCGQKSFSLGAVKDILGGLTKVCKSCIAKKLCSKCLTFKNNLVGATGLCSTCNNALNSSCDCGSTTGTQVNTSHCRECSADYASKVDYSSRFSPLQFHYTSKDLKTGDNIFLGFELELGYNEQRSDNQHLCKVYRYSKMPVNYLMAKPDGSLDVHGWEWVTAPQTLNYFNKMKKDDKIKWLFMDMFEDESCGVHVHVARTAIRNKMHEYKLVAFVDNNEKLINEIAGREYSSYQCKVEKKPSALILQGGNEERYSRVNLQNRATIELRMYASTVSEYRLSTYLENAHSMVVYTKDASGSEIKGSKGYLAFVAKNCKRYPNLHKFLTSPARKFNKG